MLGVPEGVPDLLGVLVTLGVPDFVGVPVVVGETLGVTDDVVDFVGVIVDDAEDPCDAVPV